MAVVILIPLNVRNVYAGEVLWSSAFYLLVPQKVESIVNHTLSRTAMELKKKIILQLVCNLMWNCMRFWGFFASKFIKFGDLFAVYFLSFYLHTCQIKKSNVGVSEKTKESYVIANVECYQFFASSVDLKF